MTFAEMKTRMATLLNDPDNETWAVAVKEDALNDAVEDLLLELFELGEFRLKTTTISTTAGGRTADLPSDFLYARRVYKDREYDLDLVDRLAVFSDDSGEPEVGWIEGSYRKNAGVEEFAKLGFYPIPDGAYTYSLDYFPTYTAMALDADVCPLPAPWHKLVVYDASVRLSIAKGRVEMAKGLTMLRNDLYESLMEKNTRRQRYQSQGSFSNVFGGG